MVLRYSIWVLGIETVCVCTCNCESFLQHLKNFIVLHTHACTCVCARVCTHMCAVCVQGPVEALRGFESSRDGVPGGYEPTDVGAENQTLVFCEKSQHS